MKQARYDKSAQHCGIPRTYVFGGLLVSGAKKMGAAPFGTWQSQNVTDLEFLALCCQFLETCECKQQTVFFLWLSLEVATVVACCCAQANVDLDCALLWGRL